jgi:hypothetical protein
MLLPITRRAVLLTGLVLTIAAAAWAEEPAVEFEQLQTRVKAGDRISLTSGNEVVSGTILDLSSTAVGLDVGGQRRGFGADDVQTISQTGHASLAKGAGWGAGIGLTFGLLVLPACDYPECTGRLLLSMTGIGMGIGVGFAAGTQVDHVIYRKNNDQVTLSLRPIVDPNRKGLLFTARW